MRSTIKNNGLSRVFDLLFSLLLISVLAGCGGGGGSTPDADPTGYYTGGATVKNTDGLGGDLVLTDLRGMISGNRVMIMSNSQALLYDATITDINGNNFTANVMIYYGLDAGATATPPPAPISTTISGTITEGSQITGTVAGAGIGTGNFNLTYSLTNSDTADIANIVSSWKGAINKVDQAVFDFSIASGGAVSVVFLTTPDQGIFQTCQMTGTLSPIANTTIYSVDVTLTTGTCNTPSYETNYTGFATTSDTNHNTLIVQFSNGTVAFLAELTP